jgi:hypothetical protein
MKLLVYPLITAGLLSTCTQQTDRKYASADRPNVILIYTDDVGYGDVGIYGGKVPTP